MSIHRDRINYAKSELRNYKYLLNVCHGFENKILEVQTKLEGVRSPSLEMTQTQIDHKSREYLRADLLDRLQRYQKDLSLLRYRTQKISDFLESLEAEERRIITDVYINNINIENVGMHVARSERQLKRDIDKIMSTF